MYKCVRLQTLDKQQRKTDNTAVSSPPQETLHVQLANYCTNIT